MHSHKAEATRLDSAKEGGRSRRSSLIDARATQIAARARIAKRAANVAMAVEYTCDMPECGQMSGPLKDAKLPYGWDWKPDGRYQCPDCNGRRKYVNMKEAIDLEAARKKKRRRR